MKSMRLQRRSEQPVIGSPSRGRIRSGQLAIVTITVLIVAVIFLSATIGHEISTDANMNHQVPALLNAAAADPALPTETAIEETEVPEPTSIRTARPTRTRVPTITRIPTAVFTRIAATHFAHETNVAVFREGVRTSVALTHAPTITPGRPPAMPSFTPIMGMLSGCGNMSADGPQATSCWRGVVEGQVVQVYTGREGRDGDRTQGILWIYVQDEGQQGVDIYRTPQRVGAVQIASVDGTQFTLETISQPTPQAFVFDLDTRLWISP